MAAVAYAEAHKDIFVGVFGFGFRVRALVLWRLALPSVSRLSGATAKLH